MPTAGFDFYTKPEYYADIIKRINQAAPGDRVVTATMVFQPADPDVKPILEALISAAHRKVKVTLIVDAYGFLAGKGLTFGPLFYHGKLPERLPKPFQDELDALKSLAAAGGRYVILNKPGRPFTSPLMGRSHIKFTIIGNRCYIGGCNLEGYDRLDLMVGWDSDAVAGWLFALAEKMVTTGSAGEAVRGSDITFAAGPAATLFVDAGIRKRSLIFDQALRFIADAREHIFIACQFFPNDVTARYLADAHRRGVKVTIIYNHPHKHPWPFNLLHYGVVRAERLRRPQSFFEHAYLRQHGYIHAKLIATEQGAMMGSHNYVRAGVSFGTAEIAMLVRDRVFADRAVEALMRQLPDVKL